MADLNDAKSLREAVGRIAPDFVIHTAGRTPPLSQRERDSRLAHDWRISTREIFQTYFRRGYRAVDFFLAREARRGQYLLARP